MNLHAVPNVGVFVCSIHQFQTYNACRNILGSESLLSYYPHISGLGHIQILGISEYDLGILFAVEGGNNVFSKLKSTYETVIPI